MNTKIAAIESLGTNKAQERNCHSEVAGSPHLCVGHCSMAKCCVAAGLLDYILTLGFRNCNILVILNKSLSGFWPRIKVKIYGINSHLPLRTEENSHFCTRRSFEDTQLVLDHTLRNIAISQ